MNLLAFYHHFPDEQSCRDHFRSIREQVGIRCKNCGHDQHYWLKSKEQFQCKKCRWRTTLRSGTVMENSKLPFQYWYIAMHLLTSTKKSFSALELQSQIGHKRYEPIWELMHKLRLAMGKRDQRYQLDGQVEIDEGFFEVVHSPETDSLTGEQEELKRGRGSQRQANVMVMASTEKGNSQKSYRPQTALKYVKMDVCEDLSSETIATTAETNIDKDATAKTDGYKGYAKLKEQLRAHHQETTPARKAHEKLPWVHMVISNAKRQLLGVYHSVGRDYIQNYLNEFCYKLNRRYFGQNLFDRLLVASASTTWY